MIWPFHKKTEDVQQNQAIGFEPEERPTPWLGKILLVIMGVVLLFFGWIGLGDLGDIPTKPERLSSCFVRIGASSIARGGYGYYSSFSTPDNLSNFPTRFFSSSYTKSCTFSTYERAAGVPDAFDTARGVYRTTVEPANQKVNNLQSQISTLRSQYDTSLRERIAQQEPLRQTPEQIRSQTQRLEGELAQAKGDAASAEISFRSTYLPSLIAAYKKAGDAYDHAWAGYKFWVFLLEALLVFPTLAAVLWFYFRLLRKNSPHTIILLPVVTVAAILAARTILLYFWALFLADLIEIILGLAESLRIFRVLLFYLGMILAVVIFGGAVFLLQRRIFAPERVRARRLRAKKCPYCETPIELGKNYCAGCGRQLLAQCSSCGEARFVDLRYCPYCGKQ